MFVLLPNAFGDAPTNMAIDAALLETIPEKNVVFRHYGWTEPCITFGYSQRHQEVSSHSPEGVRLTRRMTGGGIVDHRNDWTYALIIQRQAECAGLSSTDLYAKVHTALADALARQDIPTVLAPCPRKCGEGPAESSGPDRCFVQPVMNDVVHPEGAKIAGAAMKRTRKGLLIQGSVDCTPLPQNLDWVAFSRSFVELLSGSIGVPREQPEDLRPYFHGEVIEREKEKFAGSEWMKRR